MNPRLYIPLCLMLVLHASSGLFAQSDKISVEPPTKIQKAEDKEVEAEKQKERKQKLEIGMILTAGVLMAGVFLVAVILIYGRRLRRQLAAGRQPSQPRDELWHLKNPVESETPPPETEDANR